MAKTYINNVKYMIKAKFEINGVVDKHDISGAAFGKIIASLVADVLMPPIGVMIGGVDFTGLSWTLKEATATTPAVVLAYGNFIQTMVDFLIVAIIFRGLFLCAKMEYTVCESRARVAEWFTQRT